MKTSPLISSLLLLAVSAAAGEWITLFDGKPTDKLRAYKQSGFPSKNWVIEGDALKTVPGPAVDLITTDKFAHCELEFEWKVAPGGNSGIMYRVAETDGATWSTGPELQILDDSRHPDGNNPKTSAGSLYALIAPKKTALKPVGEFNKTRLVIKGDHIEHWMNGEKVVEYEWGSPEVKELVAQSKFKSMPKFMSQKEGHIAFQHHGEEAWFRNIRIRKL